MYKIDEEKVRDNILEPGFCGRAVKDERSEKFWGRAEGLIKSIVGPLYRRLRHSLVSIVCALRKDYHGIIYVDPLEIMSTVRKDDHTLKRNDMWHFGSVEGGNWDLGGIPVKIYGNIYPILRQKVIEGKAYEDIGEFLQNLELIKMGETPDNCRTENEYREKWRRIVMVYNRLKENGYKSQRELKTGYPFNEIRVQVGRNGDLLFEEGMHRLAICQLLGFERIPVIVTRRHAEWVRKNRKKIYKNVS